jgi:CelD/BcsL family acetyltransferase involved in cellulose biosynthesis
VTVSNMTSTMSATIVEDLDDLCRDLSAWDELAVRANEPYVAPDWCLAWWRHVAPQNGRLRIIVVRDADEIVGVAPFYCQTTAIGPVRYRLLGAGTSPRLTPLAAEAVLPRVARHIGGALAAAKPRPDTVEFDAMPCSAEWPDLIADGWPGRRPRIDRHAAMVAPVVTLVGDDYDGWLSGKSRNFRQQARRHRRRLADRGATFRTVTDPEEARARMADFERLHEARWRYRGGSGVLDERVMSMLRDAAGTMAPTGRLQLHLIEADDVIAAHIFLTAGDVTTYWLGGFDDAWGNDQPSLQALLDTVASAQATGRTRLDLGPGAQAYKDRLSDHEDHLCKVDLLPAGPRRALALVGSLPGRFVAGARRRAFQLLPTEWKDQAKRWLRKVRS